MAVGEEYKSPLPFVFAERGSPDFLSSRKGTTRIAAGDFGSKERESPESQSSLVPFDPEIANNARKLRVLGHLLFIT